MYYLAENNGDAISVPQVVFSKLSTPSSNDDRFRVALYMLANHPADISTVANALQIKFEKAEKALEYWEGAGLLYAKATEEELSVAIEPAHRKRLSTPEVATAAQNDAMLGKLVDELQHIFGGIISQSDLNCFVTLYVQDNFPADLILIAAFYCASLNKIGAKYIEKTLFSWRRDGITTSEQADAYLQLLNKRQIREEEIATLFHLNAQSFTVAERKRIAEWFEIYNYGKEMIQCARISAGDKANNIRYVAGILKNWHGKGYTNPSQVQQSEENANIRVQGTEEIIAPEENILANMARGRRKTKQ